MDDVATFKYMAEEGTTSVNSPEKSQSSALVPTSRTCRSGVENLPGQRYGNPIDPSRTNCRYPEAQVRERPHTSTELSTTTRVFVDPESYALEPEDTEERKNAEKIRKLERLEKQLADGYGLPKDFDSTEVRMEAGDSTSAMKKMNRLYERRRTAASSHGPRRLEIVRSPSLPRGRPHRVDARHARQFWAVLIGIDAYEDSPLRGSVQDVRLMEDFLIRNVGVPRWRIQSLIGSEGFLSPNDPNAPSRANIVRALCSLVHNPQIEHGDNIIIYFSGHGSSYTRSDYDRSSETVREAISISAGGRPGDHLFPIEAFCPIDRNTIDSSGSRVPDISDREINAILTEISRAKGHHITCILDCCHSGGITRGAGVPGTVRAISPLSSVAFMAMFRIANKTLDSFHRAHSLWTPDWRADVKSHVILAACKAHEFAKEDMRHSGYHGVFTYALVNALKSGYWKAGTTYVDLVDAVPHYLHQTPVVAGENKHERLWYQTRL